jgi:hypothetical protein
VCVIVGYLLLLTTTSSEQSLILIEMIYQTIIVASLCAMGSAVRTSLGASPAETLKQLFEQFKREHGRNYATMDEEKHRFQVFVNILKLIDARNEDETTRGGSAVHGITRQFHYSLFLFF